MIKKKAVFLIVSAVVVLVLVIKSIDIMIDTQRLNKNRRILRCAASVSTMSGYLYEYKQNYGVYPTNFNILADEYEQYFRSKKTYPWDPGIGAYWNFIPMWETGISYKDKDLLLLAFADDNTICISVEPNKGLPAGAIILKEEDAHEDSEKETHKEAYERIRRGALMVVSNYNRTGSLGIPVQQSSALSD